MYLGGIKGVKICKNCGERAITKSGKCDVCGYVKKKILHNPFVILIIVFSLMFGLPYLGYLINPPTEMEVAYGRSKLAFNQIENYAVGLSNSMYTSLEQLIDEYHNTEDIESFESAVEKCHLFLKGGDYKLPFSNTLHEKADQTLDNDAEICGILLDIMDRLETHIKSYKGADPYDFLVKYQEIHTELVECLNTYWDVEINE